MFLVEGPPGYVPVGQPMPDGACTTGRTLPALDAVVAAVNAGATVRLVGMSEFEVQDITGDQTPKEFIVIGAGLWTIIWAGSSVKGFQDVRACRRRTFEPIIWPPVDSTSVQDTLRWGIGR